MAGSKLPKIGTIFDRLTGILKAGAMKEADKPIWYDVYKTFPPKHEPKFTRPPVDKEIMPIFYPEDLIRGKFFQVYGRISVHNLLTPEAKSVMQRFVEKYQELESSGKYSNSEDIFNATEDILKNEGMTFLKRKKVTTPLEVQQPNVH